MLRRIGSLVILATFLPVSSGWLQANHNAPSAGAEHSRCSHQNTDNDNHQRPAQHSNDCAVCDLLGQVSTIELTTIVCLPEQSTEVRPACLIASNPVQVSVDLTALAPRAPPHSI